MKTVRVFQTFSLLLLFVLPFKALAAQTQLAPGHVPPAVKNMQAFGRLGPATRLNLAIGLPLRDPQALSNLLQSLYEPTNPQYRHFLTPEEFVARFGPTKEDEQAVLDFARTNNFIITGLHSNRVLVDISASAADIEKAFHLHLMTYHHPTENRDFFAPDAEPTVTGSLPILDVSGLSNYQPPRPRSRLMTNSISNAQPRTGSAPGSAYMGNDFRAAYLPGVSLTGSGQAVGLLEFDGFYANDITSYESRAGLPQVPLQTVLLDGYNGTPTTGRNSGNSEVALDIEMLVSIAPGLSNILVYEAGPNGAQNDILNRMVSDNQAKQLSCSWGWGGGPTAATDQIFQEMAGLGQSFFCASGDSDAYPSGSVDNSSQPNAPSDSPYITIVGGTTLSTSGPGGSWTSETVWNAGGGTGSSGGISSYYPLPVWQQGISMAANGGSASMRNIPDVALTADNIYVAYNNGSGGTFGGTSCAAPLWAGITALANQQALANSLPPVGFVNPALYAIGRNATYGSVFHDITTGNNFSSASPASFSAATGYDLCTGLGTPMGAALIAALAGPPDALGISPASGFSSAGLVGGPFSILSQDFSLTNSGKGSLAWSLANTSLWLNASASGGTIPIGSSTTMTISLNNTAKSLPIGTYTSVLWFTNLTTGTAQSRQFTLQVQQQVVQNGGFETGDFTGWTRSGNSAYTSVTTSSSYVHSGKDGVQMGPSSTLGYLTQTLPTVAGQAYVLSFWLENPKTGTPNEFLASWNGTVLFDQHNLPAMTWTNLQFLVTASSSSTALQFGFRDDPAYLGLDDISVQPIVAPVLQSFSKQNNTVQFTWNTVVGLIYQVQYLTNFAQTNWVNFGAPFTASNSVTSVIDATATDPQRFYRISVLP